jgi:cell division protein FtsL
MKQVVVARIVGFAFALGIPALLAVDGAVTRRFSGLDAAIGVMQKQQTALVEENRSLIAKISELSGSDRIGEIATEELGMEKAKTADIVRIELKGVKK